MSYYVGEQKATKKVAKKVAKKTPMPKAIREVEEAPAIESAPRRTRRRRYTLAEFRRAFPETAPNRYRVETGAFEVDLGGGSFVAKGEDAVLVVESAGRIGRWRVELSR